MGSESAVLILGEHASPIHELGDRARGMGFRVVRAKMPMDAVETARERGERVAAVLIDPALPVPDLGAATDALIRELGIARGSVIVAGTPQDGFVADALRGSGIQRALWLPVDSTALRFELNRAVAGDLRSRPRGTERAPMGWEVQIFQGGRVKNACVYSLSSGGAFLETPRPAMRGAQIAVGFPIQSGQHGPDTLELTGKVLYTNVPGNVSRSTLPHGMAIQFTNANPEERERLGRCIDARCAEFAI